MTARGLHYLLTQPTHTSPPPHSLQNGLLHALQGSRRQPYRRAREYGACWIHAPRPRSSPQFGPPLGWPDMRGGGGRWRAAAVPIDVLLLTTVHRASTLAGPSARALHRAPRRRGEARLPSGDQSSVHAGLDRIIGRMHAKRLLALPTPHARSRAPRTRPPCCPTSVASSPPSWAPTSRRCAPQRAQFIMGAEGGEGAPIAHLRPNAGHPRGQVRGPGRRLARHRELRWSAGRARCMHDGPRVTPARRRTLIAPPLPLAGRDHDGPGGEVRPADGRGGWVHRVA
jgi:hypothetical protein